MLQRRINFVFIVSIITILIVTEKPCERTALMLTFRIYPRFACYRQYAWAHFHKTLFSSSAHFTIIVCLVFSFLLLSNQSLCIFSTEHFHLSFVTRLESSGIPSWCAWYYPYNNNAIFRLVNCEYRFYLNVSDKRQPNETWNRLIFTICFFQ